MARIGVDHTCQHGSAVILPYLSLSPLLVSTSMAVTVSLLSCPPPSARPGWTDDSSDEPMSPRDRAHHRSDKRRAARSPSPCCYHSPSREGRYKKCRCVTACDDSPPAQWIVTTTGLLVHDPRDQCSECLAYQHHASLDLVLILETSSIINARNDCLTSLACIMGWDDGAAKLCNELASVRRDRDH